MRLSYAMTQNIDAVTYQLSVLRTKTYQYMINNKIMAIDYLCWLHNAVFADYSTITFLLKSMPEINEFDLRPIYCIMRSTLEKYVDIVNLYTKREAYYSYLNFLNIDSNSKAFKADGDYEKYNQYKKQADEYASEVKKNFGLPMCNRLTRYYLLGDFNKLPQLSSFPFVLEFNQNISKLDSKFSQILHNNKPLDNSNNTIKVKEILKYSHYMMWMSLGILQVFYNFNSPEISNGLFHLQNAINCIHSNQDITM